MTPFAQTPRTPKVAIERTGMGTCEVQHVADRQIPNVTAGGVQG